MSTITPERQQALFEARERHIQAQEALVAAHKAFVAATKELMLQNYGTAPSHEHGLRDLIATANRCDAKWSGGPTSPSNLVETVLREAAIALLADPCAQTAARAGRCPLIGY